MRVSYVVRGGRMERDRGIYRGEMLVWTEEEWRERFVEQYNRNMSLALVPIVAT